MILAASEVLPSDVSNGRLVRAGVIFVVVVLAAFLLRRGLVRTLDRGDSDRAVGRLTGRVVSLVIIAAGLLYCLQVAGVRVGPLLGALGVGGIALAFALQDILQNLVAGVLLQVRRPFKRGDQIKSGDFEGRVEDVNLRAVEVHTYDGLTVYLPNAEVLKQAIVNYTRTPLSRTSLTVGVAYDTDLPRAREVLLDACRTEGVVDQPPPEVWVEQFGDSSIDFAVRYWHAADIASRWRVRNSVAMSLKAALDEAKITIPFPQRTLWFGPGNTALQIHDAEQHAPHGTSLA